MSQMVGDTHIIKVKPPTDVLELPEAKKVYEAQGIPNANLAERIAHVKQTVFNGKRLVIFSGGAAKGTDALLEEIHGLATGGADGSIIGRHAFQRPRDEALSLLSEIVGIYKAVK